MTDAVWNATGGRVSIEDLFLGKINLMECDDVLDIHDIGHSNIMPFGAVLIVFSDGRHLILE